MILYFRFKIRIIGGIKARFILDAGYGTGRLFHVIRKIQNASLNILFLHWVIVRIVNLMPFFKRRLGMGVH